jgi:starvation-inducible DNA-binding protein
MDNLLKDLLIKCMANTFVMYYKAHAAHWNVEGMNFPQYHDFFGKLYEELHGAIDPLAEHIRAMDEYAPKTLRSLLLESEIEEPEIIVDDRSYVVDILDTNNLVLVSLMRAFQRAEEVGEVGLADFITQRIDTHQKHGWMLKAMLR